MSNNTIAINPENFQQVILEDSKNKLILVDFWAEQMPESVELRDKLVVRLMDLGSFVTLATVDCMAQQAIAQQFGVQSLPTAVLVKDGQPIDGISGPQTDASIDEFLSKHLPKEEDLLLMQGLDLLQKQQINESLAPLQQAFSLDDGRADIKKALADVSIQLGKTTEAEKLLATIMMVDQDSYYQSLMSKLELAQQASNSPEIKALELEFAQQPQNIDLARKLAAQYSQVQRQDEALALLYTLLRKDGADTDSKKMFLDILASLPDGDALVNKYRRKLFSLMY